MSKSQSKSRTRPRIIPVLIICSIIVIAIIACGLIIANLPPDDPTILPKVDITEYYYELPVYTCKGEHNTRTFATSRSSSCDEQLLYLPADSSDGRIYAISNGAKYITYYDGEQTLLYTRNTGELTELPVPLLPANSSSVYFVETDAGTLGIAFFATITTTGCSCSCNQDASNTPRTTYYHYFYNFTDVDYEFVDGDNQLIIYSDDHSYATVYDSTGAIIDTHPVTAE